jgi:hypothetical protein
VRKYQGCWPAAIHSFRWHRLPVSSLLTARWRCDGPAIGQWPALKLCPSRIVDALSSCVNSSKQLFCLDRRTPCLLYLKRLCYFRQTCPSPSSCPFTSPFLLCSEPSRPHLETLCNRMLGNHRQQLCESSPFSPANPFRMPVFFDKSLMTWPAADRWAVNEAVHLGLTRRFSLTPQSAVVFC